MFFILKYIKIIFFYFKKIIFEISISKRFKIYKKLNFKKKNKFLRKAPKIISVHAVFEIVIKLILKIFFFILY
jgi:hypothetical protein